MKKLLAVIVSTLAMCHACAVMDGKEVSVSAGPDGRPIFGIKFPTTTKAPVTQ